MSHVLTYAPLLWEGLITTLLVTAGAGIVMLITSFLLGLASASRSRLLKWPAWVIVEFFRGTSCYVQLFWGYFALPLFNIHLDAMTVGILVIGLNIGCYGSEVVRGAIVAVPRDQIEGTIALNMSRFHAMVHVVLPQAIANMIAPMGNLALELLKVTPLVSLITIADLTFQAQVIRQQTTETLLVYAMTLGAYFVLSSGIMIFVRMADRRFSRGSEDIQRRSA